MDLEIINLGSASEKGSLAMFWGPASIGEGRRLGIFSPGV